VRPPTFPHTWLCSAQSQNDYGKRIEKGEVWILEVEGEPTGVAVLEERADHLLEFADQRAVGIGLLEVRLYTNERMEANLRLYRRHAFAEIAKRPLPSRPGQVLVDMVRRLDSATSRLGLG
jgi:hypothetical protein